jgi:predicted TIM-barrel fold metal-dependent hydrolase
MKIFDSHFHIIDPTFPLVENKGFLPSSFTVKDYLLRLNDLEVIGGAVVSGSFHAFDQEYLIDALQKLGKNFFGVANIPSDLPYPELTRLNDSGVAAVRFNLIRGGSEQLKHIVYLSNKLYIEFGWHSELYLDCKDLKELSSLLLKLPSYSIDHIGLSKSGVNELYKLVEKGVRVKASGFGRLDFDPLSVMKKIMEINPHSLMIGTDLPSTRAKVPFSIKDLDLGEHFTSEEKDKILFENAQQWYIKDH